METRDHIRGGVTGQKSGTLTTSKIYGGRGGEDANLLKEEGVGIAIAKVAREMDIEQAVSNENAGRTSNVADSESRSCTPLNTERLGSLLVGEEEGLRCRFYINSTDYVDLAAQRVSNGPSFQCLCKPQVFTYLHRKINERL